MMLSYDLYYNINAELYSFKMTGNGRLSATVLKHICVCDIIYLHFSQEVLVRFISIWNDVYYW